MATFWERAAHLVYSMFSLYFDIVFNFSYFPPFGFKGETLVLIASLPGLCLSFTLAIKGQYNSV